MTDNCHNLTGKFLHILNKSYQLTLLLLGLLVAPQVLAQKATISDHTSYKLIIDELLCRGNENTQCEFITKKFYQGVGDHVDPEEIADARLRLGTLQQFKNVSIVLEKAQQRGHVNVVFVVDEAQHVQYSLGTSYSGHNIGHSRGDNFGQSAGVTDFNFLGSGKELSFNVSGFYADSTNFSYFDNNSHGYTARLSYYDPHLLNSVDYFLSANTSYNSIENSNGNLTLIDNKGIEISNERSYANSFYSVALGRRFFSHSYVSSGIFDSSADSDTSLFVAYGWNSTDDKLFATQGSEFRSQLTTSLNGDSASLSLRYQQNISLNEDYVFGYELSDSIYLKHDVFRENQFNPQMKISLSDIDSSQGVSGKYTGWRYQISAPLRRFETNTLNFGISYIYQTDALIMSFSLNYNPGFGD